MAVINEGEILAKIHNFKIFRKEGNLFINVYEGLLGKPAHKFIAVPNLLVQEADKRYFGFGDKKTEALKNCLIKIKDVPIDEIFPPDNALDHELNSNSSPESYPDRNSKLSASFQKLSDFFSKGKKPY